MAEAGITTPPTGNASPPTDPIITSPPEGDLAATPPVQDWSDDWRSKMAGGDAKEAKRLERFASPKEVFKSYRAFETRLSSGELKSAMPKDAKPENLTAWRAENGIPEDIKGEPWILLERGSSVRRSTDAFFLEMGIEPALALESNDTYFIKLMVERGIGISLLPAWAVRDEVAWGWLARLKVEGHRLRRQIAAVSLGRFQPAATRAFLKFLVERKGELQAMAEGNPLS